MSIESIQRVFDSFVCVITTPDGEVEAVITVEWLNGSVVAQMRAGEHSYIVPLGFDLESAYHAAERIVGVENRRTGEIDREAGAAAESDLPAP